MAAERWRFNLYVEGRESPFHADYTTLTGQTDEAGLPVHVAVMIKVAMNDERVSRIELVRQVTR